MTARAMLSERELVKLAHMSKSLRQAHVTRVMDSDGEWTEELPEVYFGEIEVKHPDGYTIGWFADPNGFGSHDFYPGEERP